MLSTPCLLQMCPSIHKVLPPLPASPCSVAAGSKPDLVQSSLHGTGLQEQDLPSSRGTSQGYAVRVGALEATMLLVYDILFLVLASCFLMLLLPLQENAGASQSGQS